MSGKCPTTGITGFPLLSTGEKQIEADDYKTAEIEYVQGLVDLQWGSETPSAIISNSTLFLQKDPSKNSTVIYTGLKFELASVQIVSKTHAKFITDKSITTTTTGVPLYLYDLFILLKNSESSYMAFIIPIKHDTDNKVIDPEYFTAAIPPSAGVTPKSATLGSTFPTGSTFVHYRTCYDGLTDAGRKTLHVFLSTTPILVKQTTISSIIGGARNSLITQPLVATNRLNWYLPTPFATHVDSGSGSSTTTARKTSIEKSEFRTYIQTTTFGITNMDDKKTRIGLITDSINEYSQCVQLDPDKIDNNTFNIDMINGEVVTDLATIMKEREFLKSIANGENSGGTPTDAQERVKNRAGYAYALTVIIFVIFLIYIYLSIVYGKSGTTRNILQFLGAVLSTALLFAASMFYISSYKESNVETAKVAQGIAIAGGVLAFLYWLFFYALFPIKKECDINNEGGTATPSMTIETATAAIANRWSGWISEWSLSGKIGLLFITIMAFLGGFILGNLNG